VVVRRRGMSTTCGFDGLVVTVVECSKGVSTVYDDYTARSSLSKTYRFFNLPPVLCQIKP